MALLREPTIIYPEVKYHDSLETGHFVLIRGRVKIEANVKIGSYTSIEGNVLIGRDTTIRGKCEIPSSIIGERVSIYAGVMFYDTPNPPDGPLQPPIIWDDVTLCCDVRILGGVIIGRNSYVCAGAFVTTDVPEDSYVTRDGRIKARR